MTTSASVVETHSALVFFVGDHAYKMKKPVDLGFLDFRSRQQREAVCHREVDLNRRLAPDVYLGLADVLGPDGQPCEHLVVMRRLPEERRLSRLITDGHDVTRELEQVACRLAAFHSGASRSCLINGAATRDAVLANWHANDAQMARFTGTVLPAELVEEATVLAGRFLGGRERLFDRRISEARICDGHGDLLAGDIFCLDDGPRILDCLEFDDQLRYGDELADAAFLAMDIEALGRADLAERFLQQWAAASGDVPPASLADHYIAYRAQVRCKVGCLRVEQGDASAAAGTRRLLELCVDRLRRARVRMVLVGGLPGTGKSTLAGELVDGTDRVLLRSDEIRKELAGLDPRTSAPARYGEGLYSRDHTDRTYAVLLERARAALELGHWVVLDASWSDSRWRVAAAEVAVATTSDMVEIRCVTTAQVAKRRMEARAARGGDPSDASPDIADRMSLDADPWPDATTVDTTGSVAESLSSAVRAVEGPS